MRIKNPLTATVLVFVVLGAVVCVWLLFAAPVFQEKEKSVRSENAALAKDIAEIETMNGNMEELEKRIAETAGALGDKYTARADTAADAAARIEGICASLGFRTAKIALSQEVMLHPSGALTPALYSADITFLVEAGEEAGPAVVRGLENYPTADFEVTGFVYRTTPPEDEEGDYTGEWIISATLYYYE